MQIALAAQPGQKVVKKSRNPFKSGETIGTVYALCTSLYGPKKRLAYVMEEDDTIVEAFRCKLLE